MTYDPHSVGTRDPNTGWSQDRASGIVAPAGAPIHAHPGGDLLSGSVGTVQLADGSVTTAKILDGTIVAADIADGVITLAKLANEAWTAYTPALSADTTSPTLGTGSTAFGRYIKTGRTVTGWASIKFGTSGVAAGSGAYRVSLPFAFADFAGAQQTIGAGYIFDSSASDGSTIVPYIQGSSAALAYMLSNDIAGLVVSAAAPWTWAASDEVRVNFTYEAAS